MVTSNPVSKASLDGVLAAFGQRIGAVLYEIALAGRNFVRSRQAEHALYERVAQKGWQNVYLNFHATPVFDFTAQEPTGFAIGAKTRKGHGIVESIEHNLNHQYRWLLVSAFEAYELFVRELYAALGHLDSSIWPQSHLKKVATDPLGRRDEEALRECADRIGRNDSRSILNALRTAFPAVPAMEGHVVQNLLELRVLVATVEYWRHRIVHCRSTIDLNDCYTHIGRALGSNQSGRHSIPERAQAFIRQYSRSVEGQLEVWLLNQVALSRLDESASEATGLDQNVKRLVEWLVNYAYQFYKSAILHFGERPLGQQ